MIDKNIIIVQARMSSSRLPGKSLMPIWGDMSLLEMVLRRIARATTINRVILATSTNKKEDILVPIAKRCKVDIFRGSENDVLGRFAKALEKYPAEAIVRVCADNPLVDPMMIDNLVNFFWENYPCDYAMNLGPNTGFPDGVGVEMVLADALRRLDKEAKKTYDREHVVTFLHDNPKYHCCYLYAEKKYRRPQYRLDIDFKEDLEFIRELVKRLPEENAPYWTTMDIITALDEEPELLKIRKGGYFIMHELKSLVFEFNVKTNTKFGVGIANNLGRYLKELSFERIGIIIDSAVSATKYGKDILKNVHEKNFSLIKIWEYNLKAEPDYDSLDKNKLNFLDKKQKPMVDCFVGIGGGSCIDFAKGLATLMTNSGNAITYRGFPTHLNPSLPTIAIPTTAGTGSEVTYNAVFINWADKKKLGINTKHNFPVLAILDPNLTLSCPKSMTVSSGIDALVHTLESYTASHLNPLTMIFSREAFKLIFNNLSKVLDNPKDIEIRANLLLGSYFAGYSLMHSSGGPASALSYPLGVHFKVPHGIAGGVFLPYIVEHNVKYGYDYADLYDRIDTADRSRNKKEKNQLFSQEIFGLCKKLDVPCSLKDFGVSENNIGILLEETEHLDKAFAQNPIPFSVDDGKQLLMRMIDGGWG